MTGFIAGICVWPVATSAAKRRHGIARQVSAGRPEWKKTESASAVGASFRNRRRRIHTHSKRRHSSRPAYRVSLPAQPHRYRPQIRGVAACRAVQIAELAIQFESRRDLPRQSPTEVQCEFVLAGGKKFFIQRNAAREACPPPVPEAVAGRSRNHRRRIQLPGSMHIARTAHDVSAPLLRKWKVDDGIESERINVTRRPRRLRQLQRRVAQRQVVPLKVGAESKILAVVACHAGSPNQTAAAYIFLRRAVGQAAAAAHVEVPVPEFLRFELAPRSHLFGRCFLGAGLVSGLLCRGLCRRRLRRRRWGRALLRRRRLGRCLLNRRLLGMDRRGSRQNRHQNQCQNDPEPRNRRELSNHSFSSRCRAWIADRSARPDLGPTSAAYSAAYQAAYQATRGASAKDLVRDAPAGIALAAGRHHITNFDANSARDAVPRTRLASALCGIDCVGRPPPTALSEVEGAVRSSASSTAPEAPATFQPHGNTDRTSRLILWNQPSRPTSDRPES